MKDYKSFLISEWFIKFQHNDKQKMEKQELTILNCSVNLEEMFMTWIRSRIKINWILHIRLTKEEGRQAAPIQPLARNLLTSIELRQFLPEKKTVLPNYLSTYLISDNRIARKTAFFWSDLISPYLKKHLKRKSTSADIISIKTFCWRI